MSANDKTGVGAGSGEWRTPPDLYAWLNRRFAFNFDLFASHENYSELRYATAKGVFRAGMRPGPEGPGTLPTLISDPSANGLTWYLKDLRVFANPPYSRGFIGEAVKSMALRRNEAAILVALLPAATDTKWFHEWVVPFAHIEFLKKRVQFIHPYEACGPKCETAGHVFGQPGRNSPGGHLVAIYRPDEVGF